MLYTQVNRLRYTHIIILILACISAVNISYSAQCQESTSIKGYILLDGVQTANATLFIEGERILTDEHGYYEYNTEKTEVSISASHEGTETFPYSRTISTGKHNISLTSYAVVELTGNVEYITKNVEVNQYTFWVMDPETNNSISVNEETLMYSPEPSSMTIKLALDPRTVLVPAGKTFYIRVNPYVKYRRYYWQSQEEGFSPFELRGENSSYTLERGQHMEINLLQICMVKDEDVVTVLYNQTEGEIQRVEDSGFYMLSERYELKRISGLMLNHAKSIEEEDYNDAYYYLRQAYIGLNNLQVRANTLWSEAYLSTYILIFIIALTSLTTAEIFTKGALHRWLLYIMFDALILAYFYNIFPGSKLVSMDSFMIAAAGSTLVVFGLSLIVPIIMKRVELSSGLNLYGTMASVFSLGKQSLKKRKLRSALTFTTLLIFTMGFVSLTSLSTSYGLVTEYPPFQKQQSEKGIMLRMPLYTGEEFDSINNVLNSMMRTAEGWFSPVSYVAERWVQKQEDVVNIALKAENQPNYRPKAGFKDVDQSDHPIYGILGFQLDRDPLMPEINEIVTMGSPLSEEDTCLIHELLIERGAVQIGQVINVGGIQLRVVGAFDSQITEITDMDGKTILPLKHHILETRVDRPPVLELAQCLPTECIITSLGSAVSMNEVEVSRIDIQFEEYVDIISLGKTLAVTREYRFWVNDGEQVFLTYMGNMVEGKGLPLAIPWGIVVLNVVATMMSAMYERKKEIGILSSIGLNPAHISGIFMTEAAILGIIAGGFGYLMGLGLYPLMNIMSNAPVVSQKVSALWSIATIGISIISVMLGSILALRNSAIITPSHKIKWRAGKKDELGLGVWDIDMPVLVEDKNLSEFMVHMDKNLNKYKNRNEVPKLGYLSKYDESDGYTYKFSHLEGGSRLSDTWSLNRLEVKKNGNNVYNVKLIAKGNEDSATKAGSFIRKIVIEWNAEIGKTL